MVARREWLPASGRGRPLFDRRLRPYAQKLFQMGPSRNPGLLDRSRLVNFRAMAKKKSTKKPAKKLGSKKDAQDVNELAASIVAKLTAGAQEETRKNPAAVALGRMGGLKGGKARAKKLSAKKRSEIARKAAKARWRKGNE